MSDTSSAAAAPSHLRELHQLRTRVQELEDHLTQSQKLQAIGSLAGGVAHDFNNLLTAILGYASLLREEPTATPPVLEALDVIEKAAERASQLTSQLLGFARRGEPKRVRVDVHQTLSEMVELLRHTIEKSVRIETRFEAESPVVMGDPSQIFQVFLNLALNARDAMPDGGTLMLVTDTSRGTFRVSVIDSGPGIPPQIRDRIFEPFFTTKAPNKGTGMGLTVVQNIVKAHGGRIDVDTDKAFGTVFTVLMPLAGTPSGAPIPDETPSRSMGKGSVLVIDDEEFVRQVASRMLKGLGYHVTCLGNPVEAVDYYRRRAPDVDVVIVDMVMPEMSGRSCFEELREINPRARVVLSSGFNQDPNIETLMDQGAKAFLSKPYSLQKLSEILSEALKS